MADTTFTSGTVVTKEWLNDVNRTVYRDIVNVKNYGAVADGSFVAGGSPSGTDNLAAFNSALASGAYRVYVPSGVYYLSGKLTIPRGVTLVGDGTAHLPVFLSGTRNGSVLLINGAAAGDCVALAENTGHNGLENISVYHTNTNAVRAVVSSVGNLYPRLRNVEIASLRPTTGSGLYVSASSVSPNWATLWGEFDNIVVLCADVGTSTEASVRYGLRIQGVNTTLTPNANAFKGGNFIGTWAGLYADADVTLAGALSCVFHGTKFDTNWNGTFTPAYKAAAQNVFGYTKANCYIYPTVQIKKGYSFAFHGCYFEAAGAPTTFNDGVNGTQNLISVVWLDDPTEVSKTGILDCNFNAVYLFDAGTQTLATPTTGGQHHTTRNPAHVSVRAVGTQSVSNATWTKVQFSTVMSGDDSELEWDATNNRAVIRSAGTYMIFGQVEFTSGWATAGTYATCRVVAGGYTIQGNTMPQGGTSVPISPQASLPAIPLVRGDTVELQTLQNQGSSQNAGGANTYLSIVKIG